MGNERPYRVLAWGCGVQSTLLGELAARGEIDEIDLVLTADPGWERQATYATRDWYAERWIGMGLDVVVLPTGNIRREAAEEHIHIPFWTDGGGPLRRQCTRHFKLDPMKRFLRERLGYHPSEPPAPPAGAIEAWLGITLDEWTRAKRSRQKYIVNRWPLLERKMSRWDCVQWYIDHDMPIPPKSACVCCPYRRASDWLEMRDSAPEEWQQAVEFDRINRENPLAVRAGSTADYLYIYRCDQIPLGEADLESDAAKERRVYGTQMPMFACESGYCGI
jgi:hypothetical protein